MRRLLEQIQATHRRHHLFTPGDTIVVGLSGGPDSTALLLLLLKFQKKFNLKLVAAHLNHGFIPKESLKFEKFSEKLSRGLGVPFFKKKINLKALSKKNKKSTEEMGRLARYEFFAEVAAKTRAQKIATAHTLDDQAETVLMRMTRGTGLKGLAGIPTKRQEGPYTLIRPLLDISKKDILLWLRQSRQPFCLDPSNKSDIFTRNRIRNHLLPWIGKHLNGQIKENLSDLSVICLEAQSLLEELAAGALKKCLIQKKRGSVVLSAVKLNRLHPALRSETIFSAITLLKKQRPPLSSSHIDAIRSILSSEEGRLEIHLPGSLAASKRGGALRIFDTSGK